MGFARPLRYVKPITGRIGLPVLIATEAYGKCLPSNFYTKNWLRFYSSVQKTVQIERCCSKINENRLFFKA